MATIQVAPAAPVSVQSQAARFVEAGAGTYIAEFTLPPKAILLDILVTAEALWTAATSAALIVGDADDDDGYFASIDLKATDLLANESIALGGTETAGGKLGAYATVGTTTHLTHRASEEMGAAAVAGAGTRKIIAKIVSVGAGTAGRTSVNVVFAANQPTSVGL